MPNTFCKIDAILALLDIGGRIKWVDRYSAGATVIPQVVRVSHTHVPISIGPRSFEDPFHA